MIFLEKAERHLCARVDGWVEDCSDLYILLDSEASKGEGGSNISKRRIEVFAYKSGHVHE